MADPQITRDPMRMEEVFQQGKFIGVRMISVARHGDHVMTLMDTYYLPEDQQMWAEDWMQQKTTWGPSLVFQAGAELNMEMRMARMIVEYADSLPA